MSSPHRIPAVAVAAALAVLACPVAVAQSPPAETRLDAVVVHGESPRDELQAQRRLTPGAVTVVDGEELTARRVQTLADLLRYVPGLWAQSASGADDVFFSSRGSNLDATNYDGNGLKLLQDGLPVTTAGGDNHNRLVDPLTARDVVVARGANALAYGASTLGGAIDFRTRTALDSPRLSVLANGGAFGQGNLRVTAGAAGGAFDGLVSVEGRHWDGFREHSEQRRAGFYANAGWQLSPVASSRLYASLIDNDQQLAGMLNAAEASADPRQASPFARDANYGKQVRTWRLANVSRFDLGARGTLEAGLSYERQSLYHPIVERIMVDFDGPGPGAPVEVFSLLIDTAHRDVGAMLRYRVESGAHTLLAGANFGDGSVHGGNHRNDGGRRNGLTERVSQAAGSFEGYVLDHWRIDGNWTAVYGAQLARATRDVRITAVADGAVRNPRADYTQLNPRLGAIRRLGAGSELFASVSRLFEAPTTFELEDDVRGGDATLEAMRGTVVEIGWRGEADGTGGGRWQWELGAYHARIRDEILAVEDPAAPGTSLTANVPRTTHAGIEALIGGDWPVGGGALRVAPRLSLTINEFSFEDDADWGDNALPAAPAYALQGELLLRHADGAYVGPTFDLVGRRYADFANTYRLGAYGLVGLRAGFATGRWQSYVELRNLFDRRHVATLTVLGEADADARILNPGTPRALSAGVRVDW